MELEVYCPGCLNKIYLDMDETVNFEDIQVETSIGYISCPNCGRILGYNLQEGMVYELRD